MAASTDIGRREDRAADGRALAESVVMIVACWLVVTWPMMLGMFVAGRQDVSTFTAGWYAAGLVPEAAYLALLGLAVAVRVALKGNRPDRAGAWLRRADDPAALMRWWDGAAWTAHTRWDVSAARPSRARPATTSRHPSGCRTPSSGACDPGRNVSSV